MKSDKVRLEVAVLAKSAMFAGEVLAQTGGSSLSAHRSPDNER